MGGKWLGGGFFGGVGTGRVPGRGVGDVKSILEIAGRVLLGHEESVEIPEAGLDKAVLPVREKQTY